MHSILFFQKFPLQLIMQFMM